MNEEQLEKVEKLVHRLDNSGLKQYVALSGRPVKIFMLNFMSGVARGLGFTVGTAIVLAIAYKVLSYVISMNIPYLTELLNELVAMIKGAG